VRVASFCHIKNKIKESKERSVIEEEKQNWVRAETEVDREQNQRESQ
jgi:hypothetical protein